MSEVETLEQEIEVQENPLAGLVQAALDKDYNKANEIFGQAISVKMDDVLDQERIKIAGQIFNGDDPEEDDDDEDVDNDEELDDEEENSSE
jgi:hypothetical protein